MQNVYKLKVHSFEGCKNLKYDALFNLNTI